MTWAACRPEGDPSQGDINDVADALRAIRGTLTGSKTSTVLGPVEIRAADDRVVRPIVMTQVVKSDEEKPAYKIDHLFSGAEGCAPVDLACEV